MGSSSAYAHPERTLQLAPDRACSFRLTHYLVRGDRAIFQFPFPRHTRLTDREMHTMMSLIHLAYVRDDYSEAALK